MIFKQKLFAVRTVTALLLVLSFLAPLLMTTPVHAATIISAATGNWNAGATWDGGVVPSAADDVVISGANSRAVTIPTGYEAFCTSLTIGNQVSYRNNDLVISGTGSLTVSGNLDLHRPDGTDPNDLNIGGGSVSVGGDLTFVGTVPNDDRFAKITITTGTLTIAGNLVLNAPAAATSPSNNIDMSGDAGTLNLGGAFTIASTAGGSLVPGTTSIFNYNGSSAQTIRIGLTNFPYNNLHVNNTSVSGATLDSAISANVIGNVRVQGGTLSNGGFAIVGNAGKTFEVADGATFNLTGTSGMVTGFGTKTFGATSTVNYSGTVQNVTAETYGNLTFSGSDAKTTLTAGPISVAGDWNVNAGTATLSTNNTSITVTGNITGSGAITSGSGTITLGGNWTNNGTFTEGTGTVTYNGGSPQTVAALNYNNLTINQSGGNALLGGTVTVNDTLTLTSGIITTDAHTMIIGSSGSVSGGSSASYIFGNLQKNVATGPTSFEVGTESGYNPVDLAFGNVTVTGNLTAKATWGDHPSIGSSNVNANKRVNVYWRLTNSGVVFDNYSATFNFNNPGDIVGAANPDIFIVGKLNGSWTYPNVGTKTPTSTQATGITSFSDFALGEPFPPTVTTDDASNAEETSVTLNGTLTNDGGEACNVRFQYGTTISYSDNTTWQADKVTNDTFSDNITGLDKGTFYHFRAQAKNAAGTASGEDKTFLTKPDALTSFTATPGYRLVTLNWTNGDGANKTIIIRKLGSYPTDRTDGTQVYFDTGTSYVDTGLTNGTTYYYSAWSEITADSLQQYSDDKGTAQATPRGGGGGGGGGGKVAAAETAKCPLTLEVHVLGKVTTVPMTNDGVLCEHCVAVDPDNTIKLEFDEGTKLVCANNQPPQRIEVTLAGSPPLPSDVVAVVPMYELNAYPTKYSAMPLPVTISPPARMALAYDPDEVPENTPSLSIAFYDEGAGKWVELETAGYVAGGVEAPGIATSYASGFTYFALLAKLPPPPPAPARFAVSDLTIDPTHSIVGRPVSITFQITNTGGTEGSYTVDLHINSVAETTVQVTLAPGVGKIASYTITRDMPGTYHVTLGGLSGEFSLSLPLIYWILMAIVSIVALAGGTGLALSLRRRRQLLLR